MSHACRNLLPKKLDKQPQTPISTMKILVATEKPFAAVAVNGIKVIAAEAGHEVVLL